MNDGVKPRLAYQGLAALAGVALAGVLACAGAPVVFAQGASVSHPVVQAVPGADRKQLNAALVRLARDPKDVSALVEAGDAARQLGDFEAALGFYHRADVVQPDNARVLAGLGSSMVMTDDPVGAIAKFEAAERGGALPALIASDRGLAYDLVGDTAMAQRYYQSALAAGGPDQDQARMRLAVSEAITGEMNRAQTSLMPLLNRQDKPGWRTRIFTLAIDGKTDEAVDLAQKILPAQLATSIAPYLRYMPRLTRAQQAAAANLGRFPRASEIGRDEPRIAAYAAGHPVTSTNTALAANSEITGGRKSRSGRNRGGQTGAGQSGTGQVGPRQGAAVALAANDPDRAAPGEPRPTIQHSAAAPTGELPPVDRSTSHPVVQATPAPTSASSLPPQAQTRSDARPGFDLAQTVGSQTSSGQGTAAAASSGPPPSAPPPTPGPGQPSLSQIFADIGAPTIEARPAPGAVDMRTFMASRAEPKPAEPVRTEPVRTEPVRAEETPRAEPRARVHAEEDADAATEVCTPVPPHGSHARAVLARTARGRAEIVKADTCVATAARSGRSRPAIAESAAPDLGDCAEVPAKGTHARIVLARTAKGRAEIAHADACVASATKAGKSKTAPVEAAAPDVADCDDVLPKGSRARAALARTARGRAAIAKADACEASAAKAAKKSAVAQVATPDLGDCADVPAQGTHARTVLARTARGRAQIAKADACVATVAKSAKKATATEASAPDPGDCGTIPAKGTHARLVLARTARGRAQIAKADACAAAAAKPIKGKAVSAGDDANAPCGDGPVKGRGAARNRKARAAAAACAKATQADADKPLTKAEQARADRADKAAARRQPARIWVQIGVGRNKEAIAFSWRRWIKQSPALLKGRTPYVAQMGRTNRVVVGPFASDRAAESFRAEAKKAGFDDALPWNSDAGEAVDALGSD